MKARQPEVPASDLAAAAQPAANVAKVLDYAAEAVSHLRQADPVMASIIDRVGPLNINYRRERFPALVQAIIFQQLAGRAAQTIHDRFVTAVGKGHFPTPEDVLAASNEEMRGAGLSRGKMGYLRDLASHVVQGSLDFKGFPKMADDEVVAHLTRVKGIGRWTAEMFMMFNLRRPDILPVDDLGVRMAVMKAYGMVAAPLPKELREFGERWKPHRTAAAWYLWQSLRLITMVSQEAATAIAPTKPVKKQSKVKLKIRPKAAPAKTRTAIAGGKTSPPPRKSAKVRKVKGALKA